MSTSSRAGPIPRGFRIVAVSVKELAILGDILPVCGDGENVVDFALVFTCKPQSAPGARTPLLPQKDSFLARHVGVVA